MKRRLVGWLAASILLFTHPVAAEGEAGLYAASISSSDAGALMVHYWAKGTRLRSETILSGRPVVTIVTGDQYYTLDLLLAQGVAIRRSREAVSEDARRRRPFALEFDEAVAAGAEKIRSETLGGRAVDVYRVTDTAGRRTLWVSADAERRPLRIENYERASGRTGRIDYVEWLENLALPDAFFEPPPGVTLERFESYEAFLERLGAGKLESLPPIFPDLLRGPRR